MGATRNTGYLENLIQYDASDNVAIATTVNPSYKVTLGGSMLGTSAVFSSSNTATAFIPTGSTIPTNGMYLSAANTLNFATNSGSRLSISSTGAATFSSSVTATNTIQSNDQNAFWLFQAGNTTDTKYWAIQNLVTSGTFRIRALNDAVTNGINAIEISRSGISSVTTAFMGGNVGIGTTSPSNALDVSAGTAGSSGRIRLLHATSSASLQMYVGVSDGTGFIVNNNPLWFEVNGAERMRITSGGITQLFGLNGATRLEIRNTNNSSYTSFTEQEIRMWRENDSGAVFTIATQAISGTFGGHITFNPLNVERMRITGGGNVGIGTSSPATGVRLDVNGVIRAGSTKITSFSATVNGGTTGNIDFNLNSILGTTGVPFGSGEIIVALYINGGTEGNEIYKITFGGYLDPAYTQNLAWGLSGTQVTNAGAITVNSLTLPSIGVIRLNVTNSATNAINAWATIMFFDGR